MPAIPIAELGRVAFQLVDDDRVVLGTFVELDAYDGGARPLLEDDHAVRLNPAAEDLDCHRSREPGPHRSIRRVGGWLRKARI